jgi:hypothetical protein
MSKGGNSGGKGGRIGVANSSISRRYLLSKEIREIAVNVSRSANSGSLDVARAMSKGKRKK